jgi:hypothetical protein
MGVIHKAHRRRDREAVCGSTGGAAPTTPTTKVRHAMMMMMFDQDGYPTDVALRVIAEEPDVTTALDLVKGLWRYPDCASTTLTTHEDALVNHSNGEGNRKFLRLATLGWSGNEELIDAMRRNTLLWMTSWRLSASGGLHIFEYPKRAKQ